VRPVTAQAVYGQVLVPLVDYLFADRMSRMFRPVVTCRAEVYRRCLRRRCLRDEKYIIGSMGGMTGSTHPLVYRHMFRH